MDGPEVRYEFAEPRYDSRELRARPSTRFGPKSIAEVGDELADMVDGLEDNLEWRVRDRHARAVIAMQEKVWADARDVEALARIVDDPRFVDEPRMRQAEEDRKERLAKLMREREDNGDNEEDDEDDRDFLKGVKSSAAPIAPEGATPWEKYRLAYRHKLELERRGVISKDKDYDYVSGSVPAEELLKFKFHPPNPNRDPGVMTRMEAARKQASMRRTQSSHQIGVGPGQQHEAHQGGYDAEHPPPARVEREGPPGQHPAAALAGYESHHEKHAKHNPERYGVHCPCKECQRKFNALQSKPEKREGGRAAASESAGNLVEGKGGLIFEDLQPARPRTQPQGLARARSGIFGGGEGAAGSAQPHSPSPSVPNPNLERGPAVTRAAMKERDKVIAKLVEVAQGTAWSGTEVFEGCQIQHKEFEEEDSSLWRGTTTLPLPPERVFAYLSQFMDDPSLTMGRVVQRIDSMNEVLNLAYDPTSFLLSQRDVCVIEHAHKTAGGNSYVLAYSNMVHPSCPENPDYTRAVVKQMGYVINPAKMNPLESLVVAVCLIDAKGWAPGRAGDAISEHFVKKLSIFKKALQTDPKRAPNASAAGIRPPRQSNFR